MAAPPPPPPLHWQSCRHNRQPEICQLDMHQYSVTDCAAADHRPQVLHSHQAPGLTGRHTATKGSKEETGGRQLALQGGMQCVAPSLLGRVGVVAMEALSKAVPSKHLGMMPREGLAPSRRYWRHQWQHIIGSIVCAERWHSGVTGHACPVSSLASAAAMHATGTTEGAWPWRRKVTAQSEAGLVSAAGQSSVGWAEPQVLLKFQRQGSRQMEPRPRDAHRQGAQHTNQTWCLGRVASSEG